MVSCFRLLPFEVGSGKWDAGDWGSGGVVTEIFHAILVNCVSAVINVTAEVAFLLFTEAWIVGFDMVSNDSIDHKHGPGCRRPKTQMRQAGPWTSSWPQVAGSTGYSHQYGPWQLHSSWRSTLLGLQHRPQLSKCPPLATQDINRDRLQYKLNSNLVNLII